MTKQKEFSENMHRSVITSPLKTRILFRGMLLALLGIFPLVILGMYADVYFLNSYGLVTFLLCVLCITWGLKPYRAINKLEIFPYELEITDELLTLFKAKKALLSVKLSEVHDISYVKKSFFHGVGIKLNSEGIELDRIRLPKKWKNGKSYDVVLPYFPKRTYEDLENHLRD